MKATKNGGVEAQLILKELESLADRVRKVVLKQPELQDPVSFAVWPREPDPHESGPLYVQMDQNGLRIWWLGTEQDCEPDAVVCWTDLRKFHQVENDIAQSEEMRDELVREVKMYSRMAHRYRNASRWMREKYEELLATLPAEVPRIKIEK